MVWVIQAFKKIKQRPILALLFVVNLSVGFFSLLTVLSFKSSINSALSENSRELLGGDLVIRSRRDLTPDEMKIVKEILPEHEPVKVMQFYSMVAGKNASRLVHIRAIPEGYPVYGKMILDKRGEISSAKVEQLQNESSIWVYPELLPMLGLNVGDQLKVGQKHFTIEDTIAQDNAQVVEATSFAPTVILGQSQVAATGLVKFGSTVRYRYFYQLGRLSSSVADIVKNLNDRLADPAIRITGYHESESRSGRMIKYLSDYLGLVSLIAVLLSLIGVTFLFRGQLAQQSKDLAIMRAIGAKPKIIPLFLNSQIIIYGMASAGLATLLAYFAFPVVEGQLQEFFPGQFKMNLSLLSIATLFLLAIILPLIVLSPVVSGVKKMKPMLVFRDHSQSWSGAYRWYHILIFVIIFAGLSVALSASLRIGLAFTVVVGGAGLFLSFFFRWLIRSLPRWVPKSNHSIYWIALQVSRRPLASLSWLIAVSLSTALLTLVPQLHQSLGQELSAGEDGRLPSFFLFDIQEEQLADLDRHLAEKGLKLEDRSPLIRGRIMSINGEKYEKTSSEQIVKTRESQRSAFFRNRGVNLSFRQGLAPSESIIAGRARSSVIDLDNAEISVEHRFADRLGLSIGDVVEFDIQGVPIVSKIVNFRHVKWTSFRPNFFIQFQPGVLDAAPKTYIATLSGLKAEQLADVQTYIVNQFANISMVNVMRLVGRILKLTEKMSWVIGVMALLCLFCGFAVQFAIFYQQAESRKTEVGLLKALGVRPQKVVRLAFIEVFAMSVLAVVFGLAVSFALNAIAAAYLFNTVSVVHLTVLLSAFILVVFFSIIVGRWALQGALKVKPWSLLK